jgi:TRAP-type C4-dicarboxylate transport system permease small subunit
LARFAVLTALATLAAPAVADSRQSALPDLRVARGSSGIAEAWLALLFFWALGLTVLYQFITRYVFNDSAAWTEEIARYLLIATVFVGAVIGVAKNNHIQVDFFYRFMPQGLSRSVSLLTDALRVAFLAAASWLTWLLMQKMGSYQMTIVNLPMNIVYGVVLLAFVLMTWRSLWVMWRHWQQGFSVLERPANLS